MFDRHNGTPTITSLFRAFPVFAIPNRFVNKDGLRPIRHVYMAPGGVVSGLTS